jgi:hypothetical protein
MPGRVCATAAAAFFSLPLPKRRARRRNRAPGRVALRAVRLDHRPPGGAQQPAGHRHPPAQPLGAPAGQERQRPGRDLLRADGVAAAGRAVLRAGHRGCSAVGGLRRPERALAGLAGRRSHLPQGVRLGRIRGHGQADFQAGRGYFSGGQQHGWNLGRAATSFFWGGGRLAGAFPAAPGQNVYSRVRTSKVPTLLISGALDFATPPQTAANQLLPSLPNGHQVVLPGFGHTATFWNYQPQAGTRLINTYLDTGRIDTSLYTPAKVNFTPRDHLHNTRQGNRGHHDRPRRCDGALPAVDGTPGAQERTPRAQDQRGCGRSSRSSSAWADGSSAP